MKKLLAALLLVGMFFTVVHAQEDELLTVEAVKQFKYEFWQNHKDDYDTMLEQAKKAGEIFTASEGYRTLKRFEQENDPNIAPLTQEELEDLYQTGVITLDALDHVIASVNEEEKAFLDKLLAYSIERKLLKPMTLEKFIQKYANGSGKSTLLSLVCADNPQAYANDIVLFGRKRGSGESIWDIKHHIGYVSPEMHRAFLRDYPAIEVVASGLHDAVGLYKRPRPEQMAICEFWMDVFGVRQYRDVSMLKLSSGEQRLVLLARAFVKDPSLLILDEPLHGLDLMNRRLVKDVIETFCQRRNKTLIMVTHYQEEFPNCIDKTKTLTHK